MNWLGNLYYSINSSVCCWSGDNSILITLFGLGGFLLYGKKHLFKNSTLNILFKTGLSWKRSYMSVYCKSHRNETYTLTSA